MNVLAFALARVVGDVGRLSLDTGVAISMDGVGRAIDYVFIERLWRTAKYDHV